MSWERAGESKSAQTINLKDVRRDFHAFAEPAWCEFRTASKVIEALSDLGWDVAYGRDVIAEAHRMGLPEPTELQKWYKRARDNGCNKAVLKNLEGGFTGVVAKLRGVMPGPIIALRFDLDANLGQEASDDEHLPAREGFASQHLGIHHSCGHDGHTALGLAVAKTLTVERESLRGEVRLVFQPAEEGLRGAAAMVAANTLKDVNLFLGCHIGVQALSTGEIIAGYNNILASVKLDAHFTGVAAHAALSPHLGQNALLAACVAAQNLYAIGQHGDGETRVNVGLLVAGTSRNTIASSAYLAAEVRGQSTSIIDYLESRAKQVLQTSAMMYGASVKIEKVGASCPGMSSPKAVEFIRRSAKTVPSVTLVRDICDFKACDDVAVMMDAVQKQGGVAAYFGF